MDVGIYLLHAACEAAGSMPLYITAKEEPKLNPQLFNEVEETISWTMEFKHGEKCEAVASFNRSVNRFRIEGGEGWAELNNAFSYRNLTGQTSNGPINYPVTSQQAAQIDDFADCVLTGRKTIVPGELGRRDIAILMSIYEAARTGKRVKVAQ